MQRISLAFSSIAALVALTAILIFFPLLEARAQIDASQFAANPQATTVRTLALTQNTPQNPNAQGAAFKAIIDLVVSLNKQLVGATDAQKTVIDSQLAAIGAGVAQAIAASNSSTLADLISLASALNSQQGTATGDQKVALDDQLAAIGTILGRAVQANPDLADQVQTALAAAGIPGVNTAYAAVTGNTVTAAVQGGAGGAGGGIGGVVGGISAGGGGGGDGGGTGASGGGSSGTLTGGVSGGGGGGVGGTTPGSTAGQCVSNCS